MAYDGVKAAILGLTNYARTATITASEEASGHDADNLKTPSYSSGPTAGTSGTYRTTGVTANRIITFDLGASKSDLHGFALFGVNFTDAATWEWETSDASNFSVLIHNPGPSSVFDTSHTPYVDDTPTWGRPALYLPAGGTTGRYVRVILNDTANPAGFLEAAYAVIGPVVQPGDFMVGDWTPSVEIVGPIGRQVAITMHTLKFRVVSEAVRNALLSLGRGLQATGRFVLIPRPDDAGWLREAILCRMSAPPDQLQFRGGAEPLWDITLYFREVTD